MSFAIKYPGAAFAPNMKVLGTKSPAVKFDFILLYNVII
jgi:hypothetical protein